MQSTFEKMGGTYSKVGDYYLPNLALPENKEERPLGKYGMLRKTYLKEHRPVVYNHLLLSDKLSSHLQDAQEQAQHLLDTMIPQMMKTENVTEQLKMSDQMLWVGRMENIKARVEEIIYAEIVYA